MLLALTLRNLLYVALLGWAVWALAEPLWSAPGAADRGAARPILPGTGRSARTPLADAGPAGLRSDRFAR